MAQSSSSYQGQGQGQGQGLLCTTWRRLHGVHEQAGLHYCLYFVNVNHNSIISKGWYYYYYQGRRQEQGQGRRQEGHGQGRPSRRQRRRGIIIIQLHKFSIDTNSYDNDYGS